MTLQPARRTELKSDMSHMRGDQRICDDRETLQGQHRENVNLPGPRKRPDYRLVHESQAPAFKRQRETRKGLSLPSCLTSVQTGTLDDYQEH